ncbi:hypothetical protein HU200_054141 [Digitaria exilis]|uniref:GTD-binding domain-containing protein n=1 Tax=Digitaria exilis TaxID=1010633 RepID=A0A835AN82_9POAL|nr:hypothetical protein HU200_054141 [Digitaria exilis]
MTPTYFLRGVSALARPDWAAPCCVRTPLGIRIAQSPNPLCPLPSPPQIQPASQPNPTSPLQITPRPAAGPPETDDDLALSSRRLASPIPAAAPPLPSPRLALTATTSPETTPSDPFLHPTTLSPPLPSPRMRPRPPPPLPPSSPWQGRTHHHPTPPVAATRTRAHSAAAPPPPPASRSPGARRRTPRRRRRRWRGSAELEAERAAAAGAACEAMSMILRLQRDKSEAMMEARQYRRYAEERFAHDAAERAALRDALERRDAAARALAARLRACQERLLLLGFPSPTPPSASLPSSPTAAGGSARRRSLRHPFSDDDEDDDHAYHSADQCLPDDAAADVGTPRTHHLLNRMPSPPDADKGVVLFGMPRPSSRRARTLSDDGVPFSCRIALADEFPLFADDHHRDAPDEDGDRVYTVDAVHGVPVMAPEDCCYFGTGGGWAAEEEIQKLKARLQALEADRESMRHAIMSMSDEKAQVVLLREIAQQLCKDAAPFPGVPLKVQPRPQPVVVAQRKVVKKKTSF